MIESKNRELRLRLKSVRQSSGDATATDSTAIAKAMADLKDPAIVQCEQDYMAVIEAVIINFFLSSNLRGL